MAPPPATHLARPVAVPPPPAAPPPAPDGGGERPARRLVLIAGAVLAGVALVAGALVLALRTDGGRAAQAPAASPSPSPTPLSDVAAIVGRLAAARADAFSSASEAALGAVDAPGSAALEQDRAFVRRLHAAGVRLEGLRFTVAGVRVVAATGDGVTVEAQVAASAYRQVRPDGTVARSVPAQPPRRVQLSLVRVGDAWRVSAVV